MKNIFVLISMMISLSGYSQFKYNDGKATANMDTLGSRNDTLFLRNRMTGDTAYLIIKDKGTIAYTSDMPTASSGVVEVGNDFQLEVDKIDTAEITNHILHFHDNGRLIYFIESSDGLGQITGAFNPSTSIELIFSGQKLSVISDTGNINYSFTIPNEYYPMILEYDGSKWNRTDSVTICPDLSITSIISGGDSLINPFITCTHQVIDLRAKTHTPNVSYLWSNPGVSDPTDSVVSIFEAGSYIVTVTNNTNGCASVDSIKVYLDNEDPAAISFISGIVDTIPSYVLGQICITNPKIEHTYAYNWNSGLADTNPTKITAAGTYICSVQDLNNGCDADIQLIAKPSYFNTSFGIIDTDTTSFFSSGEDSVLNINFSTITNGCKIELTYYDSLTNNSNTYDYFFNRLIESSEGTGDFSLEMKNADQGIIVTHTFVILKKGSNYFVTFTISNLGNQCIACPVLNRSKYLILSSLSYMRLRVSLSGTGNIVKRLNYMMKYF